MRSYYIFTAIAAMGLLSACSSDDYVGQDSDAIHEPVILKAGIDQDAPLTRANWNSTEYGKTFSTTPLWGTNLRIALAFSDKQSDLSSASTISSKVKEYKVIEKATTASIVPKDADNTHYWNSKTKDHYACGWCTNYANNSLDNLNASYGANMLTSGTVPTNQTTLDYICSRDVLFAPVQAVRYPSSTTPAKLNFYHTKSRIDIRLKFGNTGYSFASNVTKGVIKNAYIAGDWNYKPGNYGSWTPKGTKTTITMYKDGGGYDGIMIPQPLRGITVELTTNIPNNNTISYTFDEDTVLEPGKYYIFTFNLSQEKGLTLETQITDWTKVTMTTGDLEFEYK